MTSESLPAPPTVKQSSDESQHCQPIFSAQLHEASDRSVTRGMMNNTVQSNRINNSPTGNLFFQHAMLVCALP